MDKDIKKLDPKAVWAHFAEICAIPHPSFNEAAIRKYIVDFAEKNGLEYKVDTADNVLIRKPATPGMENKKGIILQSHVDMVPQKNSDKMFDFDKDPIEPYIDGDWVTANGTTLGADNGIGVATMLAILESKDLKHGALEALFTSTEESGMVGAFGIEKGMLQGDIMLNLDGEEEEEIYVGCAGGLDCNVVFSYNEDTTPKPEYSAVRIEVKGLNGGHSGIEIVTQRANANKLLFRFLREAVKRYDIELASVDGGSLRNAIPREAVATVLVKSNRLDEFKKDLADYEKLIISEYNMIEDGISIKGYDAENPSIVIEKKVAHRVIDAVCACPNGVIKLNPAMPDSVLTSTNLARVVSTDGKVNIQCLLRSAVDSEKEALASDMEAVFELAGGQVEFKGGYAGWKPDMDSAILKVVHESYVKLFGEEPAIKAIHAGLECGIIGATYPNLDLIAFGPTIKYPHSPDEKVKISSVLRFWNFLVYILETAPEK